MLTKASALTPCALWCGVAAVLNDVACMIGCTRNSLNVVASDKGVVIGKLTFREDGDLIDCSKMGVGGKAIPASADKITEIKGDAKFILLVEKDAAFMRLAEDRFYNEYARTHSSTDTCTRPAVLPPLTLWLTVCTVSVIPVQSSRRKASRTSARVSSSSNVSTLSRFP